MGQVPIALPEKLTPVGVLKEMIANYEAAVKSYGGVDPTILAMWKERLRVVREILKREEEYAKVRAD